MAAKDEVRPEGRKVASFSRIVVEPDPGPGKSKGKLDFGGATPEQIAAVKRAGGKIREPKPPKDAA